MVSARVMTIHIVFGLKAPGDNPFMQKIVVFFTQRIFKKGIDVSGLEPYYRGSL